MSMAQWKQGIFCMVKIGIERWKLVCPKKTKQQKTKTKKTL